MLLFENGAPRLPVIIGLYQAESVTPRCAVVVHQSRQHLHEEFNHDS
ncbi:hypothetical protein [Hyalangium gracile]|nr:hypothetical protein [Hyalangium gracile]